MKKYKILKLKSGEDLIGTVRLTKDGNVKIHRPMAFKTAISQDMFGSSIREYFMLKNWLVMSLDRVAILSKDSINTIVSASPEVSSLYEYEKAKEDTNPNKFKPKIVQPLEEEKIDSPHPPIEANERNSLNDLKRYVEEMMQETEKMMEEESNLKDVAKPPKGDKMVYMNLIFSPEVIVELLRTGLINRKELGEIVNHITNENGEGMNPQKFTGNKKDKKNFGNDWTDWNSDPSSKDYK